MRTIRNSSPLLAGAYSQGTLLPGGGAAPRGLPVRGRGGGGILACTEADPPVNRMTERCKNSLRNFVADGKN